jgi:2'-5' RNA ligase
MPETTRTFIALPLPPAAVRALDKLRGEIGPQLPQARWIRGENLHVTLAFLGDVPNSALDAICRTTSEIAAQHPAAELSLAGVGVFPDPRRPRVFWAGLEGPGVAMLQSLRKSLLPALSDLGHAPDQKFSPHVTLARFKYVRGPNDSVTRVLERYRAWSQPPFRPQAIVVYASRPGPLGSEYTALAHAALG